MNLQHVLRNIYTHFSDQKGIIRFLSRLLVSACIVLSAPASATTTEGERFLEVDDSWGFMGYEVDVDGEIAAVSAWYEDGAVHIYERATEDAPWRLAISLTEPVESEDLNFGFDIWLNDNQLIVGAPTIIPNGPAGSEAAGKAFIYERDVNTGEWLRQGILSIGDQSIFRNFGRNVIIEGDRAVVSNSPGSFVGGQESVYIFERDSLTNNWNQTANLLISDSAINTVGIANMSIAGDQLFVSTTDTESTSMVRVFNWNQITGDWDESANLVAGTNYYSTGSYLGLTADGDRLLVTDPRGLAFYLFEWDQSAGIWQYDPDFTQNVTTVPGRIGKAVSLDGDRVLIPDAGSAGADLYQRNELTGQWIQVANLSLGASAGNTVTSASLSGDSVWLGTPYLNGSEGSAYAYQLIDVVMDLDADGISDLEDICPLEFNPAQSNYDGDLLGDACDLDDDNDGVDDESDAFPYDETRQESDPASTVPAVPVLLFPSGDDIGLASAFFWPVVPGADRYIVEVQHEGSIRAYEPMIPAAGACSSGQCVYYKTDAVMMGNNRWRMRAANDQGISDWSAWTDFNVSMPAGQGATAPIDGGEAFDMFPAMPVPASPSGVGYLPGVKFQWPKVAGVIDYAIEIQQDGLIRGWEPQIPATVACIDDVCEFVMSTVSLPGTNRWRLSARNDIGQTQWSDWAIYEVSESQVPVVVVPDVPAPSSPQGNGAGLVSDYVWDAVADATHYAIEIQHDGEIRGYDRTISASSACESNICRYTKPDAALTGNNRWRVGAYTDGRFSGWSQWLTFMLD